MGADGRELTFVKSAHDRLPGSGLRGRQECPVPVDSSLRRQSTRPSVESGTPYQATLPPGTLGGDAWRDQMDTESRAARQSRSLLTGGQQPWSHTHPASSGQPGSAPGQETRKPPAMVASWLQRHSPSRLRGPGPHRFRGASPLPSASRSSREPAHTCLKGRGAGSLPCRTINPSSSNRNHCCPSQISVHLEWA